MSTVKSCHLVLKSRVKSILLLQRLQFANSAKIDLNVTKDIQLISAIRKFLSTVDVLDFLKDLAAEKSVYCII